MHTITEADFDHADRVNEDGTVTFRLIPSNWRCENISPDTYQVFTGDSWTESEIEHWSEETGLDLTYDDMTWDYDHAGIVRGLAESLAVWMSERLMGLGLTSLANVNVVDTWSPQFYNFTSDGWDVEITCDPEELRALTPDFSVDAWAREFYGSVDGFASFIPGRMEDPDWRAGYDAEFRVEHLLHLSNDKYDDMGESWRMAVYEDEWEIYSEHVRTEVVHPEHAESGYTWRELCEWAALCDTRDNPTICATLF